MTPGTVPEQMRLETDCTSTCRAGSANRMNDLKSLQAVQLAVLWDRLSEGALRAVVSLPSFRAIVCEQLGQMLRSGRDVP